MQRKAGAEAAIVNVRKKENPLSGVLGIATMENFVFLEVFEKGRPHQSRRIGGGNTL
jgi:hypothetical protein